MHFAFCLLHFMPDTSPNLRWLYIAVLAMLALEVLLFHLFTRFFS